MSEAAKDQRDPRNTSRILTVLSKLEKSSDSWVTHDDLNDKLEARLESHVKYSTLVPWLGGAAVIIVGAVWTITSHATDKAEAVSVTQAQRSEAAVDKGVQFMSKGMEALQKDVNANRSELRQVYWSNRTGRRAEAMEAPAKPTPLPTPPVIRDGGP